MEIREIKQGQETYPERLTRIQQPPAVLYVSGQLPEPEQKAVAIVGARGCSGYGRRMAEWFGAQLARAGVAVISGMAEGIDGIAQRAALMEGGNSVAVLGCGVDRCYPASNRDLYKQLAARGGLISEYPSGSGPEAWHFPMRNRMISGLADLVLVMEARERSGSLITAEYALEQGKEVFAVPGRIGDPLSAGCNKLLREGAGMALTPEDVLFALFGEERKGSQNGQQTAGETKGLEGIALTKTEHFLLQYLDREGKNVSQLLETMEEGQKRGEMNSAVFPEGFLPEAPALMELLLSLCIKGVLKQENGRFFLSIFD